MLRYHHGSCQVPTPHWSVVKKSLNKSLTLQEPMKLKCKAVAKRVTLVSVPVPDAVGWYFIVMKKAEQTCFRF